MIIVINYNLQDHKYFYAADNIDQCNASWIYLPLVPTEPVPNRGDFFFIGQTCQRRIIFMGPPPQYINNIQIQNTNTKQMQIVFHISYKYKNCTRKGDFFFIGLSCQQRIIFMGPLHWHNASTTWRKYEYKCKYMYFIG